MGQVSEEMDLSAISYSLMRSCQSNVARSGLDTGPGSFLVLVLVISFPLQLRQDP